MTHMLSLLPSRVSRKAAWRFPADICFLATTGAIAEAASIVKASSCHRSVRALDAGPDWPAAPLHRLERHRGRIRQRNSRGGGQLGLIVQLMKRKTRTPVAERHRGDLPRAGIEGLRGRGHRQVKRLCATPCREHPRPRAPANCSAGAWASSGSRHRPGAGPRLAASGQRSASTSSGRHSRGARHPASISTGCSPSATSSPCTRLWTPRAALWAWAAPSMIRSSSTRRAASAAERPSPTPRTRHHRGATIDNFEVKSLRPAAFSEARRAGAVRLISPSPGVARGGLSRLIPLSHHQSKQPRVWTSRSSHQALAVRASPAMRKAGAERPRQPSSFGMALASGCMVHSGHLLFSGPSSLRSPWSGSSACRDN